MLDHSLANIPLPFANDELTSGCASQCAMEKCSASFSNGRPAGRPSGTWPAGWNTPNGSGTSCSVLFALRHRGGMSCWLWMS